MYKTILLVLKRKCNIDTDMLIKRPSYISITSTSTSASNININISSNISSKSTRKSTSTSNVKIMINTNNESNRTSVPDITMQSDITIECYVCNNVNTCCMSVCNIARQSHRKCNRNSESILYIDRKLTMKYHE